MAVSLLHLVDENNSPVVAEIRSAVDAAYRWSVREYREIDAADLAAMAERVALAMSKKDAGYIQSPRRYAFAALAGKIQEWFWVSAGDLELCGRTSISAVRLKFYRAPTRIFGSGYGIISSTLWWLPERGSGRCTWIITQISRPR